MHCILALRHQCNFSRSVPEQKIFSVTELVPICRSHFCGKKELKMYVKSETSNGGGILNSCSIILCTQRNSHCACIRALLGAAVGDAQKSSPMHVHCSCTVLLTSLSENFPGHPLLPSSALSYLLHTLSWKLCHSLLPVHSSECCSSQGANGQHLGVSGHGSVPFRQQTPRWLQALPFLHFVETRT